MVVIFTAPSPLQLSPSLTHAAHVFSSQYVVVCYNKRALFVCQSAAGKTDERETKEDSWLLHQSSGNNMPLFNWPVSCLLCFNLLLVLDQMHVFLATFSCDWSWLGSEYCSQSVTLTFQPCCVEVCLWKQVRSSRSSNTPAIRAWVWADIRSDVFSLCLWRWTQPAKKHTDTVCSLSVDVFGVLQLWRRKAGVPVTNLTSFQLSLFNYSMEFKSLCELCFLKFW